MSLSRRGFLGGMLAAAFSPAALATTPATATIAPVLTESELWTRKTQEDIINDIRSMAFKLYQDSGYADGKLPDTVFYSDWTPGDQLDIIEHGPLGDGTPYF